MEENQTATLILVYVLIYYTTFQFLTYLHSSFKCNENQVTCATAQTNKQIET